VPYQTARAEEKSRQNNLYRGLGPVERDRLTAKKLVDYAQSRDPKLREEIILMNTSLARFMAFKFQSGEDLEDLVQVGPHPRAFACGQDDDGELFASGFHEFSSSAQRTR